MPTKAAEKKKKEEQVEEEVYFHDVHTLLEWQSDSRPFKKRSKEFYINSLLIILALEVILFLFSEYMLMMVVLSVAFLVFALSFTPPRLMSYRISTEGIAVDDHFFLWQELYDFYFKRKNGYVMLHIRTKAYLPGEILAVLNDEQKEVVKRALLQFLPYREVVRTTFTEKAGEWAVKTFPLERPHHHHKPS
jgi:hypothetical protein